jgi:hypothetical protein
MKIDKDNTFTTNNPAWIITMYLNHLLYHLEKLEARDTNMKTKAAEGFVRYKC